jgi:hypothetical protein
MPAIYGIGFPLDGFYGPFYALFYSLISLYQRIWTATVCLWFELHCNENPIYLFPEKELRRPSVPIFTFMCLWAIYIFPGSVQIFSCSRIGRPIMGIYKSVTDIWMWKLGMRPRSFFSGNICFEFTVLCLCSVSFFLTSVKSHCADCFHDISVILSVGVPFCSVLFARNTEYAPWNVRTAPFYEQFIRERHEN